MIYEVSLYSVQTKSIMFFLKYNRLLPDFMHELFSQLDSLRRCPWSWNHFNEWNQVWWIYLIVIDRLIMLKGDMNRRLKRRADRIMLRLLIIPGEKLNSWLCVPIHQ